ncbi:MAG: DUF11 domain-containing protein [Bacteroidales bacterium]|nr:DUF11 domain-containing protein [Bacteroidales bacterium]
MTTRKLHRLSIPLILFFWGTGIFSSLPVLSQTHPDTTTLLYQRFGVVLNLQPAHDGGDLPSFDWATFVPTRHTETVDWIESDWYGNWSTDNWNHATIDHESYDGSDEDWYPSGGEMYDVEALYFDNDENYFYIVVITSVPHYHYVAAIDSSDVGIYEPRLPAWVRPGDLSINLFKDTPHKERYGTYWYYNYGVDVVHENRDSLLSQAGAMTPAMRDFNLGNQLYRTKNDTGGGDSNVFPDNPFRMPDNSDWYVGSPKSATTGHWEHTNFDPLSTVSQNLGIEYIGNVQTRYYPIEWTDNQGQPELENGAGTYAYEYIIPRSLFGDDNPGNGEMIGLQWVEACRNDGNNTSGVVSYGEIDDYELDFGDAPDSYQTTQASGGPGHIIIDTLYLGQQIDTETDGQPSTGADGDDQNGSDDEDGVSFSGTFRAFETIQVTVTASQAGYLDAWFDFNGDGDWQDSGEQIFNTQLLNAGVNHLSFDIPDTDFSGPTYCRFRYSLHGGLSFTGIANNGEMEDYRVVMEPKEELDIGVNKSVYHAVPAEGEESVFTVTATNYSQTVTATGIIFSDVLDTTAFTLVSYNQSTGTYHPDTGRWVIPTLAPRAQATLEITVTVHASADNEVDLVSLHQKDTNPNNNSDLASVTLSGSSGGNSGGLESDGSLAELIAQRNFRRIKSGLPAAASHPDNLVKFSETLAGSGVITPSGRLKTGSDLAKMIPENGPFETQAYITTPADLLGISNAVEVISVDYFDPEQERKAAILALSTESSVYNHTKLICDRLSGGRLDLSRIIYVREHPFILAKLIQPDGNIDYTVSFIAYPDNDNMTVDSRWHNESYHVPANTLVFNFQVWSVTNQSTIELVNEILTKLDENYTLAFRNTSEPRIPKVYVTKGAYHNGQLVLNLQNNCRASEVTISGTLTQTEQEIRKPFDFTCQLDSTKEESTLSLPVGYLFDIDFNLANNVDGMRDGLYFADGPWGLDYTAEGALINNYVVSPHDGSSFNGSLLLERDVTLSGRVKSYVSLFRAFLPGNIAMDLTGYDQIAFEAQGSGPVTLTLTKNAIPDWSSQYRTTLNLDAELKTYAIDLNLFQSTTQSQPMTPDDLTAVTFSVIGDNENMNDFSLNIKHIRFYKSNTSNTNPEQLSPDHLSNYPNPFRSTTTLDFSLRETSRVHLILYDVNGQMIRQLADGIYAAGTHRLPVALSGLKPGIYLIRMNTPKTTCIHRMTLLK